MTRQLTTEELRVSKVTREKFETIERRQVCLVLDGVSPAALTLCNDAIYLPMQGMGNSINVSNSVAIAV